MDMMFVVMWFFFVGFYIIVVIFVDSVYVSL